MGLERQVTLLGAYWHATEPADAAARSRNQPLAYVRTVRALAMRACIGVAS